MKNRTYYIIHYENGNESGKYYYGKWELFSKEEALGTVKDLAIYSITNGIPCTIYDCEEVINYTKVEL